MTANSPKGEHAPIPGAAWAYWQGEQYALDDDWGDGTPEGPSEGLRPSEIAQAPTMNRRSRRAAAKAARRRK